MLRANHFTGGAITGAVSAIDIALWDIKGKYFNVPVYELLGGKMRHKARLYGHVKGRTIEKLVQEAKRLKDEGFSALGHLNPLLDEDESEPYYKSHAAKIEEAIDNVRRLREAVGPSVDLCIEIHRRLTPPEAIALGRGIEKYTPMFFEDPLRPNSFDAMAWVADHINIPVATGERFHSLYQFQTLLTRHGVEYLRPDVCLCGGITGAKKIAAIAEAHDTWIVPHNPLSPISTAACLQIAACIPNFAIQEYPSRTPDLDGNADLLGNDLAAGLAEQEGGFIRIPEGPGLGVELVPDAERRFPPRPRPIRMRPHADGSVVDQ
jgi:galactonate dehydratase